MGKKSVNLQKDNPHPTPEQAANFAKETTQSIREQISNNPNIKINNLQLKGVSLPQDNTSLPLPVIKIQTTRHSDYLL